jgi:hypothetical protein
LRTGTPDDSVAKVVEQHAVEALEPVNAPATHTLASSSTGRL